MIGYLEVKPFGPWKKVMQELKHLDRDILESATQSQRTIAERLKKIVIGHLKNQDIPGWEPLSPYTRPNDADRKALIDTRTYIESIKTWRENFVYSVGVKRGIINPKNGIEVARIAYIHEYWSGVPGKPYRPLWSYSIKEMGGLKGMRLMVETRIRLMLIKKGFTGLDLNL